MVKLEPKKGRYDNDWKISVNTIFAVAEQCNRTDTVKQAPVECGNCINEIKNKKLEISKLQEDKEVLQKALEIMDNN